jgi:hypothetical protein
MARQTFRELMDHCGYKWQDGDEVDANGEHFAWGQFVNGDRKVRFAFGQQLVLLKYHSERAVLDHEQFVQGMGGTVRFERTRFFDEPAKQLEAALSDLREVGESFLEGNVADFHRIAAVPRRWDGR